MRRLNIIIPVLLVALGIFLVFYGPIQSIGIYLARWTDSILDSIMLGDIPQTGTDAYFAKARRIELISIIVATTVLAAIILPLSWWLYSVGKTLAYSLGYRAPRITSIVPATLPPQVLSPPGDEARLSETSSQPVYLVTTPLLGIQTQDYV